MKYKKLSKPLLLGVLTIALGIELAHGVNIDTSRFFAWQKTPDKRRANVTTYGPYIFLSKEKCQAKGVGKEFDAKKAVSVMPGSSHVRHQCWSNLPNSVVLVCPVGDTPTESIGTACIQIPKDTFEDIGSLPRAANF